VRKNGHDYFKNAIKDYDVYVNTISLSQYQKNLDLKEEIFRQKRAYADLQNQIANYSAIRQQMTMELATALSSTSNQAKILNIRLESSVI
jgi:hypothetical protein